MREMGNPKEINTVSHFFFTSAYANARQILPLKKSTFSSKKVSFFVLDG